MNKYQEAMNYLWKSYDENKIYGIASRGYLEMLQELVAIYKQIKELGGGFTYECRKNVWRIRI